MNLPAPSSQEPLAPRQPTVVVGIDSPEVARRLIPVGIHAARARSARRRVLLSYEEGSEPPAIEVTEEHHLDLQVIPRSGRPDIAFRAAVHELDADLLIVAWHDLPDPDTGTADDRATLRTRAQRIRDLFLDPPCDTWLVYGGLGGRSIATLLVVPSNREPSSRALRAAAALLGSRGEATVLDVHGGDDATPSGSLLSHIKDTEASARNGNVRFQVRSVVARSRERATIDEAGEHAYDALVMDVPEAGVIPGLGAPALPDELMGRLDGRMLVVVNHRQGAIASRVRAVWDIGYSWMGTLSQDERHEVYSDLRRSARANHDFLTLTVLATAIASMGLLLNSAAVIIGAMLVAPFMSPLIAMGLAVVHGDARFMRVAAGAILRGTAVGVAVGVIVGLVMPPTGLTDELLARTEPSGIDLMVALFSGAAGAYAFARRDLSAALPGVAIAAALVPPLSAAAIALSAGDRDAAVGAGLLYVMNVGAIAGAAAVIFLWFGFRPEVQRFGRVRSFFGGFTLIAVLLAVVFGAIVVLGAQDRRVSELTISAGQVIEDWLPPGATLEAFEAHRAGGFVEVDLTVVARLDVGDDQA
ncbi:MAG: DUF389 domain-containing protein, partial [Dehalococcoidia bacterium]